MSSVPEIIDQHDNEKYNPLPNNIVRTWNWNITDIIIKMDLLVLSVKDVILYF
jgi:hypothetical protein